MCLFAAAGGASQSQVGGQWEPLGGGRRPGSATRYLGLFRGPLWLLCASRVVRLLRLFESASEPFAAVRLHVRNRSRGRVLLCELLSLGCPLLCTTHEVLEQLS